MTTHYLQLELVANTDFELKLQAMIGAGFLWKIVEAVPGIDVELGIAPAADSPLDSIGGSIAQLIKVRAQEGAAGILRLIHQRPWLEEDPLASELNLRISTLAVPRPSV